MKTAYRDDALTLPCIQEMEVLQPEDDWVVDRVPLAQKHCKSTFEYLIAQVMGIDSYTSV